MDNAVPTIPTIASPYTWQDADPASTPQSLSQSMDGGPQVSQPTESETPSETPRSATMRRVATAAAGVGLVAAAVLTA